jgi:hypothetical protein
MPPVPRRRGRPPGSRNKKTLEALAAAAAAEPFGVSRSTVIVVAPRGAVALAAATSVAGLTGTPLEAAAALVGTTMAVGAAPPGLTGKSVGGSSSAAAGKARKPQRPPPKQRLSYTPKHGFATSMVHLLAGCEERLPLPTSFEPASIPRRGPPRRGGEELPHRGLGEVLCQFRPKAGLISHPDPPLWVAHPLCPHRR